MEEKKNKVNYKNFWKLASNLASRAARHVEQQKVANADRERRWLLVLLVMLLQMRHRLPLFGFHQLCPGLALPRWNQENTFVSAQP